jgi:hypothetical protein
MQIKTTIRHHFTSAKMAKIKSFTKPNVDENMIPLEPSSSPTEREMVLSLWKTIW